MQPGEPGIADHQLQKMADRRDAAAIQFVGRARVVEQHLVQVEEFGAQIVELRPDVLAHRRVRRGGWRNGGRRGKAFGAQAAQTEPLGHHAQRSGSIARPRRTRPIPVELEAIPVGIAQIQRLADAVVARALERDAGLVEPAQRVGERGAIGISDRDMIETRRARRAAAARPGSPRC